MGNRAYRTARFLSGCFASVVRNVKVPPQGFSEDHTGQSACHFPAFTSMVTGWRHNGLEGGEIVGIFTGLDFLTRREDL
jgi:hypothetical protein